MDKKNYILVQEWVGDAFSVCGIYESLKDFIKDYRVYIESDGTVKFIKYEIPKNKMYDCNLVIHVEFNDGKKSVKGDYRFITKNITTNSIIY
jgi:hypothetical protein